MHGLIDYIADWELEYARQACAYIKPDALFHHDDWGSMISSFMSPDMFREFMVPAYKRVYGYYREHGVEVIVHHSDSYAANLVPAMIEIGIDMWRPQPMNDLKKCTRNMATASNWAYGLPCSRRERLTTYRYRRPKIWWPSLTYRASMFSPAILWNLTHSEKLCMKRSGKHIWIIEKPSEAIQKTNNTPLI